MRPARRPRILSLLCLLPLALGMPSAAAAEEQSLRYLVWLGGVSVMDLHLGLASDAGSYGVTLTGQLTGPPSWFYDIRIGGEAAGQVRDGAPVPERYRLEMSDDGKVEWLALAFDGAGLPSVTTDPPMGNEGRKPLAEADKLGALDPLGAMESLLAQAAASGTCPAGVKVFDGRRRFDVAVADGGEQTLRVSAYNLFHGSARRCEVTLKPVGGFRRSGRDLQAFPQHMTIFLAPLAPGGRPVPVRIETETDLGALLLHLIDADPPPEF